MENRLRAAAPGPWLFGLLLTLALAWRFENFIFLPEPLFDERIYLEAGRAVLAGRSPFNAEYLYLPGLAWLIGQALAGFGQWPLLVAMRALGLGSAVAFAWIGSRRSGFGAGGRQLLVAAFLLGSPAVVTGIGSGNLTFPVALLVLLALELARRRPYSAGLLLGLSLVVKPLAPAVVAWLAGCRSASLWWGLRCALPAGIVFLFGFLPLALLADFLGQIPPPYSGEHNASVYRLIELAGGRIPPPIFSGMICLGALALAGWRRRDDDDQLFLAIPALLIASPLVWNHTLCLAWPIEAAALGLAWRRRHGRLHELAAVALLVLLLTCWRGAYALPSDALPARFVLVALTALAPVALAAYWWRLGRPATGLEAPERVVS